MDRKAIENKDEKVWVTIDRTINLGNFESIKISAGLSRTIGINDPTDLLDTVCDEVFAVVRERSKEYKRVLKPKPKM